MREKHQCEGRVGWGDFGRSRQCSHTGSLEHEGKNYCKSHHPPSVNAKREERSAKAYANFDAKRAEMGRIAAEAAENKRRAECFPDLLKELKDILEWAVLERAPLRDQEISSIREAIRKATGEQQ